MAGLLIAAATIPTSSASAQGLFDFLFGSPRRQGPPPGASAYSDPFPGFHSGRRDERHASGSGGPSAYCVRLCDGRYFPIQRVRGASPAELCNSFCPGSATQVYSGSGIDAAVASDGSRYASLRNAFVYRERTVDNCTCNGRDPYGLMPLDAASDPTLRPGDMVATNEGFVVYNGGNRRNAEFTPVESWPGLSAEFRERLAATRITPNNATPVSAQQVQTSEAAIQNERDRRYASDR